RARCSIRAMRCNMPRTQRPRAGIDLYHKPAGTLEFVSLGRVLRTCGKRRTEGPQLPKTVFPSPVAPVTIAGLNSLRRLAGRPLGQPPEKTVQNEPKKSAFLPLPG